MPLGAAAASVIGAGISAGTNLIAGSMADDATAEANRVAAAQAKQSRQYQRKMDRKNIELQKQFAQEGIRWKVADAEAAGIHPLYALGAQTMSFNPVTVGGLAGGYSPQPEHGMSNALANAGQDVSRAIQATRTQSERDAAYLNTARALQLQNMGLQNELLASQIAKTNLTGPPMPELGGPIPEEAASPRKELMFQGWKWETEPSTSSAQDWNNRYGDEFPGNIPGMTVNILSDLYRNSLLGRYQYGLYPFNR